MVFSSPIFLFLFLPITLILAYVNNRYKWRNIPLLIMSMFFYAFGEGELLLVMFGSITLNFFIGKWIGRSTNKAPIIVGVALNLLLLVFYKYTSFIIENVNYILAILSVDPVKQVQIKLPVGISFYTFQSISYLIDVYRRQNESQKSYVDLALYVCLFPQLIAGPIVRYKDVAWQLQNRTLNSNHFFLGLERFIIGLGKKVIIANSLGSCADVVFDLDVGQLSAPLAWFAILCYSLQLYFDFSAYSDMAIGLGKMIGFDFLENFRFPYKSKSIREFWQRWHISLSNWFRDYLYIPLGGNRVSAGRVYINLFIVFFLTGLWHGASWNFVIWGMLHGCFMVIERLGFEKILQKWPVMAQRLYMAFVVVIAWVFFRAHDYNQATQFIQAMFSFGNDAELGIDMVLNREVLFAFFAGLLMSVNGFNWVMRKSLKPLLRNKANAHIIKLIFINGKSIFLLIIFIYSALSVAAGSYNPFIYFRF